MLAVSPAGSEEGELALNGAPSVRHAGNEAGLERQTFWSLQTKRFWRELYIGIGPCNQPWERRGLTLLANQCAEVEDQTGTEEAPKACPAVIPGFTQ